MENSKRNKPGGLVIAAIAIMVIALLCYFVIMQFFPDWFITLPTGDTQPVDAKP